MRHAETRAVRYEDEVTAITRHLFRQRDKKAKNALRRALIDCHSPRHKPLSKLEATRIVEELNLKPGIREARIGALSKNHIQQIIRALRKV